ncbi:MAG TPA: RodZ domain-containing protein [Steroidobacteraceae bacterium]|nr:RodZ domain-containing protein [Steroidobacteraceae bacterium]
MSGPADKTAASSVGERLRAARERQGLTLQKMSEDLHLDLPVIEAMEEDRFRMLGAPVYARGHLRKYAQLLGLEVGAVLEAYEAAHTGPVAPSLVPASTEHPALPPDRSPASVLWIRTAATLGVLALIAAGVWWYLGKQRAEPESAGAASPVTANEVEANSETMNATVPVPVPAVSAPPAVRPPAVPPRATTKPAVARTLAPDDRATGDAGEARLRLRFLSESWAEIYDATGTRLLFDQRAANTTRTVVGVPPFRVLLGNSAGVELSINGRPVTVPDQARYGATARFRVMPGGSALASWGAQ